MKNMKKLAALFMAMVMAFSLMAVTAAAYGEMGHVHDETCAEESVQPRTQVIHCPKCGGDCRVWTATRNDGCGGTITVRCYDCVNCGPSEEVIG